MAITITSLGLTTGNALRIIRDSDADGTSENNVNDGAATIYAVTVDNAANAAITYVKFWDSTLPTVGTTAPDMILMVAASVARTFVFRNAVTFSTGLSVAAVTTAGTAGTTNPTSNVPVNIVVG